MSLSQSVQLISTALPTSPTMKKSNVCRCLFGRPDRETEGSIPAELKREQDEDLGVAKLRWGFDFEMEQPLCNGPYEWTRVDPDDIPSFYKDSTHASRSKSKAGRHPSARLRRNIFNETDVPSVLSFSSEILRGAVDSKQSCLRESPSSPRELSEVQTSDLDPIQKDITTPCVKKLKDLEVSDDASKLNKIQSVLSTCSTGSTSSSTLEESTKTKVQSSMLDYLRVRKRKSSSSLSSRSAKSLRRLW